MRINDGDDAFMADAREPRCVGTYSRMSAIDIVQLEYCMHIVPHSIFSNTLAPFACGLHPVCACAR